MVEDTLTSYLAPSRWLRFAELHLDMADTLFRLMMQRITNGKQPDVWPQHAESFPPAIAYFVAIGIENALKAMIVYREPSVVTANGLGGSLAHHKLNQLADRAKVHTTEKEKRNLDRLTRFIQWSGRYPGPKTPEALTAAAGDFHISDEDLSFAQRILKEAGTVCQQGPARSR